ncbi:hypothetical protein ACJJIW_21675 [Microbulbifer sp. JMSA004]|uniref:hypothetical protein n=1 Tax=unclassified Microbulbifer TaxID=2619833 RepID=UPI0024ACA0D0|nr:hypothetical protein [Microbulbifer sp. VAAF005]WHI46271.1 hypothetical protein P0078_21545 [Microbulbifer sp. VAAF005]
MIPTKTLSQLFSITLLLLASGFSDALWSQELQKKNTTSAIGDAYLPGTRIASPHPKQTTTRFPPALSNSDKLTFHVEHLRSNHIGDLDALRVEWAISNWQVKFPTWDPSSTKPGSEKLPAAPTEVVFVPTIYGGKVIYTKLTGKIYGEVNIAFGTDLEVPD